MAKNRTAADVLKDMERTAEGDPQAEALADEFVQKLAEAPREGGHAERKRRTRPHPPRTAQASA